MKYKLPASIAQSFTMKYSYQLYFTEGLFQPQNELLAKLVADLGSTGPVRILAVVDQGVADHHPELEQLIAEYAGAHETLLRADRVLTVPGGEAAKNDPALVEQVLAAIEEEHICRHSLVLAIGGGAVIDMVGFAATIAHRGVRLIRVPTTVLAQNDAAVGVKNGVNRFGKKNFVGAFATPYAIVNDLEFLHTLDQRDWISGVAEAVKVALIKDAVFYARLDALASRLRERDMEAMMEVIHRCAEIHMQHIAQGGDPFEGGSSRPLDFGHWAAHKLEQLSDYRIRHGEAVARGMALDVTYAKLVGHLDEASWKHILQLLQRLGFQLDFSLQPQEQDALLQGIEEFREHLGGRLTITLITGIGEKLDVHEIDYDTMRSALQLLDNTVKN